MRRCATFLLVSVLACSSSTGNDDDNENPPPPPGDEFATVNIRIRGLSGQEAAMEVRYAVAAGPITRAAESVIPRPAPLQFCVSVGDMTTCPVQVPVGQTISLYAYEGYDGAVVQVAPNNGFTLQGIMHEFVRFQGNACLSPPGFNASECAVTPSTAGTYEVEAQFTILPTYRIRSIGVTNAVGTVTARDVLGLPVRANIFTEAGTGGISSSVVTVTEGAFAMGTEVTLVAQDRNQARFIRWEGCQTGTGGTNRTCTLPTTVSGTSPATVTLVGEYWQCPNGVIGDGPAPNCTLVRP